MKINRIIEMIDEYLTEPHSINREWVEALMICKKMLSENKNNEEVYDIGFEAGKQYALKKIKDALFKDE